VAASLGECSFRGMPRLIERKMEVAELLKFIYLYRRTTYKHKIIVASSTVTSIVKKNYLEDKRQVCSTVVD
jgi:hypothetical protein